MSSAEAFRAGHYKDLTETGNRARKVSGTQGNLKQKGDKSVKAVPCLFIFFLQFEGYIKDAKTVSCLIRFSSISRCMFLSLFDIYYY